MHRRTVSSPFPPPDYLREFEFHSPGFTRRFEDNFLRNDEAARELAKRQQDINAVQAKRGALLGLTVVVFTLSLSAWVVLLGQPVVGSALATVNVVALARVFVKGTDFRRSQARNVDPNEAR